MLLFGFKCPSKAIFEFRCTTGFLTVRRGPHSFAAKPENQIDSVPVCLWITNIPGN